MMTDPASAIKREVFQLVELQIETLQQEGRLTDSALVEYHERSEKITELYREIDRIVRSRFDWRSIRASWVHRFEGSGRCSNGDYFRLDSGLG